MYVWTTATVIGLVPTHLLVILYCFRFHKSHNISPCDSASVCYNAVSISCTVKQEYKYFVIFCSWLPFDKVICMHIYVCEQKGTSSCETWNGRAFLLAKIYIKYAHLQMFRGLKIKKNIESYTEYSRGFQSLQLHEK